MKRTWFSALATLATMAHATDDRLSLPEHVAAPLTLRFSEPETAMQVFVASSGVCCEGRVAVAGRVTRDRDVLTFTPAFGFVEGVDYVARIQAPGEPHQLVPFRIRSERATADAIVTEVFPSGDVLPENVLRFYIHFAVPMAPHVAFDHITLRDGDGVVDDAAFMRFKQELWNEDRTRLTVLIDPGRIKREVATNRDLGPALTAGETYHLTVEGGWPSADGTRQLSTFSKAFSVSAALRERPDVQRWAVSAPCVGTRDPIEVALDRPFDRHALATGLRVMTHDEQAIAGTLDVVDGEQGWRFVPDEPWAGRDLRVVVDPDVEDVAGNNFRDLLDGIPGGNGSPPSNTVLSVRLKPPPPDSPPPTDGSDDE